MAAGCADAKAPFNTGEGGFAVQHISRVAFKKSRKFFKYIEMSSLEITLYKIIPGVRFKNRFLDTIKDRKIADGKQDLYLFCKDNHVFYTIDWSADLKHFPKQGELTDEFGHIILQIGSGLYGLKKHTTDGSLEFNWTRFQKIMSFCRAIEIKLAQGAKQSG